MNKKTTLIIASSAVVIAVLAAAGIFFAMQKQNPTPVAENSNPSEVQTTTVTENEEVASSSPANSSLASATAPGLSSCVMLDEKYCDKGTAVYLTGSSIPPELNGKLYGAGFNLQEKIKIYSPFDGVAQDVMYTDENGKEVKMIIVTALPMADLSNVLGASFVNADLESSLKKEISTNGPKKMIIYKDSLKKTDENIVGGGVKVSKGELIGTINDLSFTKYASNFIIDFSSRNLIASSRPTINIEKLKEYFSYIK